MYFVISQHGIMLLIVLTSSITCSSISDCSLPRDYSVSSSGNDSQDCINSNTSVSCATLDYLISHTRTDQNCLAITILDPQQLSGNVTLTGSHDISIVGSSVTGLAVDILCEANSGIVFENCEHVHLENLNFIACGSDAGYSKDYSLLTEYAALYFSRGNDVHIIGCSFINGTGTGVIMRDVTGDNLLKKCNFIANKPQENMMRDSSINATYGGVIIKQENVSGAVNHSFDSCSFNGNKNIKSYAPKSGYDEGFGGGLSFYVGAKKSKVNITILKSNFSDNFALEGGGLHINQSGLESSIMVLVSHCMFENNFAHKEGGGIFIEIHNNLSCQCNLHLISSSFSENTAMWGGGLSAYTAGKLGQISITANQSYWSTNNANTSGMGVALYATSKNSADFPLIASFYKCVFLRNTNKGHYDKKTAVGAIYNHHSKTQFIHTSFINNFGSALYLHQSAYATFGGNTSFSYNHGIYGAAIYVDQSSVIALSEGVVLSFKQNLALLTGGAIYTETSNQLNGTCVFISLNSLLRSSKTYSVIFSQNIANGENQSIYIKQPENCFPNTHGLGKTLLLDSRIFTYSPNASSQIRAPGSSIILNSNPEKTGDYLEVMLGEIFALVPTVLDVFNGNARLSGDIILVTDELGFHTSQFKLIGPGYVGMDIFTKNNGFHIVGNESLIGYTNLSIEFIYDKKEAGYREGSATLKIKLLKCKLGFMYERNSRKCECHAKDQVLLCSPFDDYACIKYGYWYGYHNQTAGDFFPCAGLQCGYFDGKCPRSADCPNTPGFCELSQPDDLCFSNDRNHSGRGGLLCSECRENYSFTFSALYCVPSDTCTIRNTTLIVLGLVLYWIVIIIFVLFILCIDLSIGAGFMYGIIYFFSVATLFTDNFVTDSFLLAVMNTCVAITQLSPRVFGVIMVCFVRDWNLHLYHLLFCYATPLFVVSTIVAIIWLSRCCRCPKSISLAQNSPIHAICMLILFSYTAMTYTSVEILKPITVAGTVRVKSDPNLAYFHKEHIPYALVAVFFECFISLPICILLLLAPCLSNRVNIVKLRLKPFLDEFQACYRPKCRWFAGFYFLARQVMYLAMMANSDTIVPVILNMAILVVHTIFQPYKLKWLNILDTILLTDVLLLSILQNNGYIFSSSILSKITHYILILIPSVYLLAAIMVLLLKRISVFLKSHHLCNFKNKISQSPPVAPTFTSINIEGEDVTEATDSESFLDSFYKDTGEREPLLSENDSEKPRNRKKDAFTTNSLRITGMKHFPPPTNKATTN